MIGANPISSTIIFLVNDFEPRIMEPGPLVVRGEDDMEHDPPTSRSNNEVQPRHCSLDLLNIWGRSSA